METLVGESNALKGAFVYDNTYFTKCDMRWSMTGDTCSDHGILHTLFDELSSLLNISFHFDFGAKVYGYGHENDSVMQRIKDGIADFGGPDLTLIPERAEHATQSIPLTYSKICLFSKTHYSGADFQLLKYLEPVILILVVSSLIASYIVHNLLSDVAKTYQMFSILSKGSTTICFVTTAFLLNLYGNEYSASLSRSQLVPLQYKDIETIRKDIENGALQLVFGQHSVPTMLFTDTILYDVSRLRRTKIMSALMSFDTSQNIMTDVKVSENDLVAVLFDTDAMLYPGWYNDCEKPTLTSTDTMFGSNRMGFYFSHKSLNKTKKFRRIISNNPSAILELYNKVKLRFITKHRSRTCTEISHHTKQFTISLKAWMPAVKHVLIYGCVAAVTTFSLEILFSLVKWKLQQEAYKLV